MKNGSLYISLFLILLLGLPGCEQEERTTLTGSERKLVDSIYARDISYVRRTADSICDISYQKYLDYYIDSLRTAYYEDYEDIKAYLNQTSNE